MSVHENVYREQASGSDFEAEGRRPTQMSAEQNGQERKQAARSKALHAAFGEIVNLLMRAPDFRHLPLNSLEGLVLPSLTSGQFAILEGQKKGEGLMAPMAVILWASVSEDVDRKLSVESDAPTKLKVEDWKSGNIPWIILAVGDTRLVNTLKAHVEKTVFEGRAFKYRPLKGSAPTAFVQ